MELMQKVEFTEVETESLINNLIQQTEGNETVNREELGITEGYSEDSVLHVYIVFKDQVTIQQGIDLIQTQVCKDGLQVSREDKGGNAIVAIVSGKELKEIEKLDEVSSIKIDTGAETQESTTEQDSIDSTVETEETVKEEKEGTKEETTEQTAEETKDQTTETVSTVSDDILDTENKTGYVPIVTAVLLGVAILLGILFVRKNK